MQNSGSSAPAPISALAAGLSASAIDVRCALILARVALQATVDANPDSIARVRTALDSEIENVRLEQAEGADAVIGIIGEFKNSLGGASDNVWYIE